MTTDTYEFDGAEGRISVRRWSGDQPRFVALVAHGYGEHAGRYDHVADALVGVGAVAYAPDHLGHGLSSGERALVRDVETMVTDLHAVADRARNDHPDLPVVLVGHSMGGLVATRFAQRYPGELVALVLSGPLVGGNPGLEMLLGLDPIPDVPIDPAILSRDPAIGEAYAADPLVYHGPFLRETLIALVAAVDAVADGGSLGSLPTLWVHGDADQLVPYDVTAAAFERIKGDRLEQIAYPGAAHEVFNETNSADVIADVTAFLTRTLD